MVGDNSDQVGQAPSPRYPDDLVDDLVGLWDEGSPSYPVALEPDRHIFSQLIHGTYQASLTKEEGQPTQISTILTNDKSVPGYKTWWASFPFESTRPFNAQELRRLGPATTPDETAVAVTAENGELVIWGLVDIRSQELLYPDWRPPNLVATVRGPGWIDVDIGFFRSLTLRDGVVAGRSADPLPLISPFANKVAEQIVERLSLSGPHPETDASRIRQEALRLAAEFVGSVTNLLRKSSHGATAILVLSETRTQVEKLVDFKYPLRMEPLAQTADLVTRYRAAEGDPWPRENYERQWRHRIETFANLSGVDGVAVVTDELQCLGFGGQILTPRPTADTVPRFRTFHDLADTPEIVAVEDFGTRHRSALALCDEIATAVALVVSQDGGLRVIGNVEGHGLSIVERS